MANDYDKTIPEDLISLFDNETYRLQPGRKYQGKEQLPAVYIYVDRSKEAIRGTGVYSAEIIVQAKSKLVLDADESTILAYAKMIRDVFKVEETDLIALLNTLSTKNTYYGILQPGNSKVGYEFHEIRDESRLFNYPLSISFSPTK